MSSQNEETGKAPATSKRRGGGRIRPWQALAIVAVLALGGAGGYFGYDWLSDRGSSSLGANQQLIPVTRGDLTNQVSTNGSVIFPVRETLRFGASGTVGEVLVAEGDSVAEGQALASLDDTTIAGLERAAAVADVALREAEDNLAEASEPADALALAQAESAVATAQVGVQEAQEVLDALLLSAEEKRLDPAASAADALALAQAEAAVAAAESALRDAQQRLAETEAPADTAALAQARATVATAELTLQQSQEELDALLTPDEESRLEAAAAVTDARIALDQAGEALAELEALPDSEAVETAQNALNTAQESYDNAATDLSLAETEWSQTIATAEQAVSDAEADYAAAFTGWLGVSPSADDIRQEPSAILETWGADLDVIYPQADAAYFTTVPVDDPATPWDENLVFIWSRMLPGIVVGTCDSGVPRGGRCVMAELESAWNTLDASIDALDSAQSQSANALTAAREAVNRARDTLTEARDALEDIQTPASNLQLEDAGQAVEAARTDLRAAEDRLAELDDPDPLVVASARADVELAEATLAAARSTLADVEGPDPLAVNSARSDVEVAAANLASAREHLAALESPDALHVASARSDLDVAEAMLMDARATLEDLRDTGTDELLISLRETELRESRAALEGAKDALDGATISAPWAGTVNAVAVDEGEHINMTTVAIEIVDPTISEVAAVIDEIDVLSIAVGADASIVMDALPGQTLPGTVVEIGQGANSQSGVVTYPVSVRIDTREGLQLVEGLSATASVIIREEKGVLLVPNQAIGGSYVQPTVRVSSGGKVTEVPVALGSSDDFWVVVLSGISEGDTVVMEGAGTSATADWRLQRGGMQAIPFQGSADAEKLRSK